MNANSFPIHAITRAEHERIRNAVMFAIEVWRNADPRERSRREDLHKAFRMIRGNARRYGSLPAGIDTLEFNALRHLDMTT